MAVNLYPVALNVQGRHCVVVGGGAVGERKTRALLEAGARVRVVSPTVTDALGELVRQGRIAHHQALFAPEDLDRAFLAIAATSDACANAAVAAAARARGLLVNLAAMVDETIPGDEGDFVTMAAIRRGELLIALTTGGAGPALTARLRRALEAQFGAEWGAYVGLLREMRDAAKQRFPDAKERTAALRRLADCEAIRTKLAQGDGDGARAEAITCLS